jgi:hypothetical protein
MMVLFLVHDHPNRFLRTALTPRHIGWSGCAHIGQNSEERLRQVLLLLLLPPPPPISLI